MQKIKSLIVIVFILLNSFLIVSSYSANNRNRSRPQAQEEKLFTVDVLRKDEAFVGIYEKGKIEYEELFQFIQTNNESYDDGERVILQDEYLTYIFHKKHKVIERWGLGYKILIYSHGIIDQYFI